MVRLTTKRDAAEVAQGTTLGHLRLRNVETNEIILIPTPSTDPNDPLNWSQPFKIYVAILVCFAMFFANFLAAGATVAIVATTIEFFGPMNAQFGAHIAKVAYFFTTTALLQGTGNIIWMPFILKYGRRPVYILSFVGYTATAIWSGVATSYSSELAARILMGFFAGSAECVAPLTIVDIFFLHERGFYMGAYNASLSAGVSGGIIISGLITIHLSWRYIYYIASGLIAALTILVILTLPETAFNRSPIVESTELSATSELYTDGMEHHHSDHPDVGKGGMGNEHVEAKGSGSSCDVMPSLEARTHQGDGFVRRLRLFHGTFTHESYWKMFYRPIVLLAIPSILWATLVMSVTIGFLVSISSNFATAFSSTYNFSSWQSGLCFISGIIGTFLGIFGGGTVSDWVADYFTKRNGGIREPEMRLPAITIGLIASPLGLLLYGFGISNKLHWMVPTLGLGFLSFAIAQATNVSLVYIIDSYRPIAGETVVTQLAFKSCFGFLLSFYTNPWIDGSGYANAFGAMAGISAGVLLMWIPFYIWGRQIRVATLKWKLMTHTVGWDADREVGE